MTRYRFVVIPLRKVTGPWRDTRDEAVDDAISAGFGERDEFDPTRPWLHALAEIETKEKPLVWRGRGRGNKRGG